MREFLISICPWAIWGIAAAEAVIAALLLRRSNSRKQPLAFLTFLLTIGLVVDAVIIGAGSFLPADILRAISPVRFIAHGTLIALLFPICGYALRFKKPAMFFVWLFTAIVMIAGAAQAAATVLEPRQIAGVVRYAASASTPKWADMISKGLSFGTVIPMIIVGVITWIKRKTPHFFLSGLLMFALSALGPVTGNTDLIFFISMFGELLMVLFLYFYDLAKKADD